VAAVCGVLAWHILRKRRNVAVKNAEIIGVADPELCAKNSFRHTFKSYLETAYIRRIDQNFLDKYVTCEGKEHYDALRQNNIPFVFINAHMGSWDLSVPVITARYGFKGLAVGREMNSRALNRILEEERSGEQVVYVTEKGYIEKVAEYEKQGYVTGSLLDHAITMSNSVTAPFFGLKVRTAAGIAAICARKKMPMLPSYLIRTKKGFHIVTHSPIYPDTTLKPKERIEDLAARMNSEFEKIIREYPDQWYLLHRRFKKVIGDDGETHSVY
jgi:KDO2-lipid IV(A) lauroyltransferase